jgi:RNA recognition motif-containing protein
MSTFVADPTIYIGQISTIVTEKFLNECFEGYFIKSLSLEMNAKKTSQFAFLTFETQSEALKFMEEFNYSKIDNSVIHMSLADAETEQIRKSGKGNLIVKNLAWNIEDFQLHQIFREYGEIISCMISRQNGHSKGFGFVQFRKPEEAAIAKKNLDGRFINSRRLIVADYKKW